MGKASFARVVAAFGLLSLACVSPNKGKPMPDVGVLDDGSADVSFPADGEDARIAADVADTGTADVADAPPLADGADAPVVVPPDGGLDVPVVGIDAPPDTITLSDTA